jgi:hypothetical protein
MNFVANQILSSPSQHRESHPIDIRRRVDANDYDNVKPEQKNVHITCARRLLSAKRVEITGPEAEIDAGKSAHSILIESTKRQGGNSGERREQTVISCEQS